MQPDQVTCCARALAGDARRQAIVKTPLKIRPATEADVETLFDIRCSVTENFQSRAELESIGICTESVKEMIISGDYFTVVVEKDQNPIGFAMARISEGYVFACFVRPDHEGQGAGKLLLKAVEDDLFRVGIKQAWLSTDSNQEFRAYGFYRHLGWVDAGYQEDGEIKLVKDLKNA